MKVNEGNFVSATVDVPLTPVELVIIQMGLNDLPDDYEAIKEKLKEHIDVPVPFSETVSDGFTETTSHLIAGTKMFLDGKIHHALNEFLDSIDPFDGTFESQKKEKHEHDFPFGKLPTEMELKLLEDLINETDFAEKVAQMAEIDPNINAGVIADGQMVDLGKLKDILQNIDDSEYMEIDDNE